MSAGANRTASTTPAPVPALDARLTVDRPGFRLDIALTVAPGEVVALLGPNGAGKTTALRAVAGLVHLSAGHVRLAGTTVDDPTERVWVPPERRGIGVVFQDYLLFPHLSALDNVAFGLRSRGVARQRARAVAAGWLDRVALGHCARRRPRQLSGGQAQRVALARALAVEPTLLLLDEPLAALDAGTRVDTRAELHRHLAAHAGGALVVTHDPLDAAILADRLIVVEDGRIVQAGDAVTITAQPQTDYVARLVGLNLYRGHADGHAVALDNGFKLTVDDRHQGGVFVAFRPAAVALHQFQPEGSPRNVWQATVTGIQHHGDNLRVQLGGPLPAAADITPDAAAQLRLAAGEPVWAAVKATEIRAYASAEPTGTDGSEQERP
ncbi:MAG: ATP-binding cassette domain-containing protein [Micromonosporaceae bacterium]|nr:ATP-binding cassette domain-containing protein [Micromonosporaceae bacterium]